MSIQRIDRQWHVHLVSSRRPASLIARFTAVSDNKTKIIRCRRPRLCAVVLTVTRQTNSGGPSEGRGYVGHASSRNNFKRQ